MPSTVFLCCSFFLYYTILGFCLARDNITFHSMLNGTNGETLISAGQIFELGFFTPNGSSRNVWYVGIWYYKLNPKTFVWVANRDNPLPDSAGRFAIGDDGSLQVLDKFGRSYWSTDERRRLPIIYTNVEARLLDSGNLVLRYIQSTTILWQSFEHLVDTFLPGMDIGDDISLNSWKSEGDPAQGNFTLRLDQDQQNQFVVLRDGYIPYWKSGESDEFDSSDEMRYDVAYFLSNFSRRHVPRYSQSSPNVSASNCSNWRIVMNSTGEMQYRCLVAQQWVLEWQAPRDRCSVVNACGNYGICNNNSKIPCKCLPGFNPIFPNNWNNGDFSGGCTTISDICGSSDRFLSLKIVKVRKPDSTILIDNGTDCRKEYCNNCQCQAYSEEKSSILRDGTIRNATCWIWTSYPNNLQEEYTEGTHELFVRVANSSRESTSRSCEPCGTNLIPYPLSTGPNCGDPFYYRFNCDNSTGITSFTVPTGTYNVTRIDQTTTTFFIEVEDNDCQKRNKSSMDYILRLNQTLPLPFKLVNVTCESKSGNFGSEDSLIGIDEIEIRWDPPSEPTCTSSSDCKDWPYSTCNVSRDVPRCNCNTNFKWNSSAVNCTQEGGGNHEEFGGPSGKKTLWSLIVAATIGGAVVLSIIILCIWLWRRKMAKRQESTKNLRSNTEKQIKELLHTKEFEGEDSKSSDVHFFDFDSIVTATDNFSDGNKLGHGGFGPVYKGKFLGGQDIAIKRLSSVSGQAFEEFKNEVLLIARLQHRNLVRLVGYCLKGDERILLYEYMPNKSLDLFIFDSKLSELLHWEMRFNIILGVARGLLYLHQDSRLRIIHRDLKTANILLDDEMNPKISDFGLARIVEGKQKEASTTRVVGTFGYMAPEYAMDGLFSVKSDVYSFGVVVLEILSGKKNTAYFNILRYAWTLWTENKALELMEETLSENCNTTEFSKCLNVALLCIQEDPADRPTMSNVVVLLSSETETFPPPKKPAFIDRGSQTSASTASSSKQETLTDLTTTSEGQ